MPKYDAGKPAIGHLKRRIVAAHSVRETDQIFRMLETGTCPHPIGLAGDFTYLHQRSGKGLALIG